MSCKTTHLHWYTLQTQYLLIKHTNKQNKKIKYSRKIPDLVCINICLKNKFKVINMYYLRFLRRLSPFPNHPGTEMLLINLGFS